MRQNLLLVYFRLKKVGKRWGGCCQEALLTQWSPCRLQFFSEGLDRGVQICTEYSFLHSSEEKNNDKQAVPLFSRLDHGSDLNRVLGTSCNTLLSIHTPTSLLLLCIYTPATIHPCQSTSQPLFFCSIYIHQLQHTSVNPHPNLHSSAPYVSPVVLLFSSPALCQGQKPCQSSESSL